MTGLLREAVNEVPDRSFLDFAGEVYTFGEVDQLSSMFAHALTALGVTSGGAVASILETSIDSVITWLGSRDIESVITWLGVNKAGGVWVPLNTAYKGDFLRHELGDSDADVVICDAEYVDNVLDIADELPRLRLVVKKGGAPREAPVDLPLRIVPLEEHLGGAGIDRLVGAAVRLVTPGVHLWHDRPFEGCMISQNYMCSQGVQCGDAVRPQPGETMCTCLPLFHVSALSQIVAALAVKECLAISPRFSVSRFWAEIERSGARNALLMGSILSLLAHADETPEMIRCRGPLRAVTSVPATPDVRRIWRERFGVEHINSFGYGLTEGSRLALHRYRGPDHLPPETSCGEIASDRFDVVILGDDDQVLPDGQVGEIGFRPRRPGVMFDGYWKRPADTVAALRNLWMHSGDLGRIENGILFFVDRKKDYLRNRGENISSFEVERAFLQHPELVEVAVHEVGMGVAEDRMKVTAVRVAKSQLTEEELCRWVIQRLLYFAAPRFVEFRDDLPRTPTSEVTKFRLREDAVTASTWDREKAGIEVRRPRPAAGAASSDTHDLGASRHRGATRPKGDRT